jgi:hypothetical protein
MCGEVAIGRRDTTMPRTTDGACIDLDDLGAADAVLARRDRGVVAALAPRLYR